MSDDIYLEQNRPNRTQYRAQRRARPTGAIVIHTAENRPDLINQDTGAENVANWIRIRDSPGSYHTIVDSDSILRIGRYEWEMFHESTGGNRWSLGLAFATRASQWTQAPEQWVRDMINNGAIEAHHMATWIRQTTGITVPAKRIDVHEYRRGYPGFISHAELDPKRRHDPGPDFPWKQFTARFAHHQKHGTPRPNGQKDTPMPTTPDPEVREWQRRLIDASYDPGIDDGDFGPKTLGVSKQLLGYAIACAERERGHAAEMRTVKDRHVAEIAAINARHSAELRAVADAETGQNTNTTSHPDQQLGRYLRAAAQNLMAGTNPKK